MATRAQIDELREKMAGERGKLLALLDQIDEERAERRPPEGDGEDAWSVKEQLAHLASMEAAYRAWVERALSEQRPQIDGERGDPTAYALERAHEATVAEHSDELKRQRERTLALIAGIEPAQYERTAISSAFGELTVMQWLRSYYRHDRMHQAQIEGRTSDYEPRFLSGEEPDQRRRG